MTDQKKFDMTVLIEDFKKIPNRSGVYIFNDDSGSFLYVGKSLNLRNRIYSHLINSFNTTTHKYGGYIKHVSVIFHDDTASLDQKETEVIELIKPNLNISKNSNQVELDLPPKVYKEVHNKKCSYYGCTFYQLSNGYCEKHDPQNFKYTWIEPGKLLTTEMKRLLYEENTIRTSMYFYMSKNSFSMLMKEHNFEIDRDEDGTYKFGKHYIILDDEDEVRLFRYSLPL